MLSRSLFLLGLAFAGLLALVGCAGSDTAAGLGGSCRSNADCASDGQLACGVDASGKHSCISSCAFLSPNYTCVDGVPTSCKFAPPTHCSVCGCSSESYCPHDGTECAPKHAVGEPCETDEYCSSDNCSRVFGVCRVPLEATCTIDNCDVCLVAEGWSYCSRECGAYECHGRICENGICNPQCNNCPGGKCQDSYDRLTQQYNPYCACARAGGCHGTEAPRPLGQRCVSDEGCESNLCDSAVTIDNTTRFAGLCSKPCTSSADCGEGFACAAVEPSRCLPTCVGFCETGTCYPLPTTEATNQTLCWTRHQQGELCAKPSDCLSSNCVSGKCADPR